MKLKIHPLCGIYFLSFALFASVWAGVAAVAALFVHEAAHLLVGYGLGEHAESIELTPFGGVIRYPIGISPKKGIRGMAIAAAGPLANYAVICLLSEPQIQALLPDEFGMQLMLMNVAMLMLNTLPVLPLDGGQMVFCAGYYVFPIGRLTRLLSFGGMAVGMLMILLGLYGAIEMGKLNLSLLLVGAYLMVYAHRNRSALWMENLYAVLQECQTRAKRLTQVRLYKAQANTKLVALMEAIADSSAALFRIDEKWIDEEQIISALMANPNATVAEMLEKNRELS